ncbi:MAG TPA: division/cell wall cluster transcriptional repressor MraZ [Terracidiphilus sp.]|jgi:MraZ protein|nr:division/cell wall cluster transcriptional repressor MraZ [Terracidiphilus sp.]
MYRGNHPAKVDEKGRLKVPSAFKALLDAATVTQFFVTSTNGRSAEIWPLPEWEKVEQRLLRVSALDPAVEQYLNLVNYYGQQVEMDSQGRILLPQMLRTKARLDAEVNVMGKLKFIEVHNKEIFEKELPPEGISPENKQKVSGLLNDPE